MSKVTNEEREALNQKHLLDPMIGDYWHDMFTPIYVVVSVGKESIVVCRSTIDVDKSHWTWDVSKTERMTKPEFRKKLLYSSMPKTWATVVPTGMKWVRQMWREELR